MKTTVLLGTLGALASLGSLALAAASGTSPATPAPSADDLSQWTPVPEAELSPALVSRANALNVTANAGTKRVETFGGRSYLFVTYWAAVPDGGRRLFTSVYKPR